MLWHAAPALVVDWVCVCVGGVLCADCLYVFHRIINMWSELKFWRVGRWTKPSWSLSKSSESRGGMRWEVEWDTPLLSLSQPLQKAPRCPRQRLESTVTPKKTDLESRSLSIKISLQSHLRRFANVSVALPVSCLCFHGSFSVPSVMRVTRWAGRPGAEQTPFVLCFR